jgi:hypothetical protein
MQALYADYNAESEGSDSDRASALGRLGMSVGLAFMVGPAIGAHLVSSFSGSAAAAIFFTFVSAVFFYMLPTPKARAKTIGNAKGGSLTPLQSLLSFVSLPAAQTPAARLLFSMRVLMGLAFHVFYAVWTTSLKKRFDFGPKDHAYFMGWIGLCYALSQGVLAKRLIARSGHNPTRLLLLCMPLLSLGRLGAMVTSSLPVVYAMMALVIGALGVVNTAMSTALSRLAGQDQGVLLCYCVAVLLCYIVLDCFVALLLCCWVVVLL